MSTAKDITSCQLIWGLNCICSKLLSTDSFSHHLSILSSQPEQLLATLLPFLIR